MLSLFITMSFLRKSFFGFWPDNVKMTRDQEYYFRIFNDHAIATLRTYTILFATSRRNGYRYFLMGRRLVGTCFSRTFRPCLVFSTLLLLRFTVSYYNCGERARFEIPISSDIGRNSK